MAGRCCLRRRGSTSCDFRRSTLTVEELIDALQTLPKRMSVRVGEGINENCTVEASEVFIGDEPRPMDDPPTGKKVVYIW